MRNAPPRSVATLSEVKSITNICPKTATPGASFSMWKTVTESFGMLWSSTVIMMSMTSGKPTQKI